MILQSGCTQTWHTCKIHMHCTRRDLFRRNWWTCTYDTARKRFLQPINSIDKKKKKIFQIDEFDKYLEDIFSAIGADTRVCRDGCTASRALKGLGRCLDVLEEIWIFNHQITGYDGQWEFNLDFGLAGSETAGLGLVPHGWFVLQFHNSLYGSVDKWIQEYMRNENTALFAGEVGVRIRILCLEPLPYQESLEYWKNTAYVLKYTSTWIIKVSWMAYGINMPSLQQRREIADTVFLRKCIRGDIIVPELSSHVNIQGSPEGVQNLYQ